MGVLAGLKVFNDFVSKEEAALTKRFNIINLTGDTSLNKLSKNLFRVDYVTTLYQPLMETADLVITRGGSNTLFELLALKKLHLIVPLGKQASRGDQLENARYFEEKGYAKQLREDQLNLEQLLKAIQDLFAKEETYIKQMAQTQEIQSVESFYALLRADMDGKENHD